MSRQFSLGKNKSTGNKQWVHPPEALLRGHIVYNVKFLGHVEVEQPKGTDVVKEAIRKMKFNKHLKRAEGQKPPKVELTISADGVTIQEPKYKVTQHQYPLHRISYCADDKADKRMFTFIAKEPDNNTHHCFVFDSEKCTAEEITLTIGQAFDLAYKRFLETSGKDMDTKKQFLLMQKKWANDPAWKDLDKNEKMKKMLEKVQQLTQENLELKARCADMERLIEAHGLTAELDSSRSDAVVGRKLENLIFDEDGTPQQQTNGTAAVTSPSSATVPTLAPPPPVPPRSNSGIPSPHGVTSPPPVTSPANVDLFGATPFNPTSPQDGAPASQNAPAVSRTNPFNNMAASTGDPFGMGSFNPSSAELDQQIRQVDRELLDLETGFKSGLTIFSLEDLDPLNAK